MIIEKKQRAKISLQHRKIIEEAVKQRKNRNEIAVLAEISPATVFREVKLNSVNGVYNAEEAHRVATARRRDASISNPIKFIARPVLSEEQKMEIFDLYCNKEEPLYAIGVKFHIGAEKVKAAIKEIAQRIAVEDPFPNQSPHPRLPAPPEPEPSRIELLEMQVKILTETLKELYAIVKNK